MSSNWAPAPARSPRRCWPPALPPTRLALVERDPELAAFLRRHFAEPQIIEGDAARLPRLLADHGIAPVAAVVSSLPLLSLPTEVVNGIVHGVFEALPRGAALIQFTYGPTPPVPRALRAGPAPGRHPRRAHLAQRAARRRLDLQKAAGRVTPFRFDVSLRDAITDHLGRFDRRRRADTGGLKHAAVAIVVVEVRRARARLRSC